MSNRIVLCAIALSLFSSHVALADSKQECTDAFSKTQDLRDAGKNEESLQQAQICARDVCSKSIREKCTQWVGELQSMVTPTAIFTIVDSTGAPVTNGSASVDGQPWALDGAAHPIAKGSHTVEVTVNGAPPHKETITMEAGEKDRKITITIAANATPPAAARPPIGAFVVGGIGVASLVTGAVLGGFLVKAHNTQNTYCHADTSPQKGHCTPASDGSNPGYDAENFGRAAGPADTVLLVGGGLLTAAGIIWLVAAPRKPQDPTTAVVLVAPAISSHQKGVVIGGSF